MRRLQAFVDGELQGADRIHVARHLADCASCGSEADLLRDMGDTLRRAAAVEPAPLGLAGLAGG